MTYIPKCKICSVNTEFFQKCEVLSTYQVSYFLCKTCGLLQTEKPFWLDDAYEHIVHPEDVGALQRNIKAADLVEQLISFDFDRTKKFLDYAGGCGVLTRLMRDKGFDFYWHDPFCKNIFAKGYEYNLGKVELITCFEGFEHFVNPISEIEKILSISDNLLFSTELLPDDTSYIPNLQDWWYYGLSHGQHINFYSLRTLEYIADQFKLKLFTNKINLHFFTKKKKINSFLFEQRRV